MRYGIFILLVIKVLSCVMFEGFKAVVCVVWCIEIIARSTDVVLVWCCCRVVVVLWIVYSLVLVFVDRVRGWESEKTLSRALP